MIASQGGPKEQLARFRSIRHEWLHVVTSLEHAKKAEAAGVDALVAVGMEAGGHPAPNEVTTLVLVRRLIKAVKLPIVQRAWPTAPASLPCSRSAQTP